jgi:hypothetical protein
MTKKFMRADDGMYHIHGHKYSMLIGSRAQIWHGTAYKTKGGLTKSDLLMNKRGHVVSKKLYNRAKREKRLEKAGYFTQKGKFGWVKRDGTKRKGRKNKGTKKRRM